MWSGVISTTRGEWVWAGCSVFGVLSDALFQSIVCRLAVVHPTPGYPRDQIHWGGGWIWVGLVVACKV
jgi:hypothetical protein